MCHRRVWIGILSLSILSFTSCKKSESPSGEPAGEPSGSGGSGSGTPSTPGAPKPGHATGKITGEDGKPITAPGAKIAITIYGISSKSGEKVYYNPKVNADGTYEQKLVDGTYSFSSANIDVPFNGKHFQFYLDPVGDDKSDRDSDKGIQQNYIWKLKGLRPGQDADESNFTHWYGASVNMQFNSYRNDIKKGVSKPPTGTKCVFTLTPTSKLIDGSDGKPLTFTREYDPLLSGLKNGNLPDIPLADYTVKGEEIAPDGTEKPLLMQQAFAKFGESAEVHFQPGSSTGPWPVNIGFTREE